MNGASPVPEATNRAAAAVVLEQELALRALDVDRVPDRSLPQQRREPPALDAADEELVLAEVVGRRRDAHRTLDELPRAHQAEGGVLARLERERILERLHADDRQPGAISSQRLSRPLYGYSSDMSLCGARGSTSDVPPRAASITRGPWPAGCEPRLPFGHFGGPGVALSPGEVRASLPCQVLVSACGTVSRSSSAAPRGRAARCARLPSRGSARRA